MHLVEVSSSSTLPPLFSNINNMKRFIPSKTFSGLQIVAVTFLLLISMSNVQPFHAVAQVSPTMATLYHKQDHRHSHPHHSLFGRYYHCSPAMEKNGPNFSAEKRRVPTGPNPLHN